MRFCLSSRQTPEYLKLADDIKVQSKDINQIYDLLNQYPNKRIIYNLSDAESVNNQIEELMKLAKGKLILSLFQFDDIEYCQSNDYPFFLAYPATTMEIARTMKDMGVCEIIPDNQLAHQLPELKILNLPVRYFPVSTFLDGFPRQDGVAGNWIRPEDIEAYSIFINTIDFGFQPQKREQALYRIYAQEKEWQGELGRLIPNLNYIGENPYIPADVGIIRMNCGLTCQTQKKCRICYNGLAVSASLGSQNLDQIMNYKKERENTNE